MKKDKRQTSAEKDKRQVPPWLSPALLLLLAAVIIVAFWPGVRGAFVNWDDDRNFTDNTAYRGLGPEQLGWAATTFHMGVWQPISWVILSVQYKLGGMEPRAYHMASVGLHVLTAAAFYWLVLLLLRCARRDLAETAPVGLRLCAFAAAVLFAVHPLRVEVVSWISCQPYLPMALFACLTLAVYVHGFSGDTSKDTTPGKARTHYGTLAGSFGLFLLAITSKAPAVALPVLMLILDVYPLRRIGGHRGWLNRTGLRIILEKLPFLAVAAVASVFAAMAKDYAEARAPFQDFDAGARFAQAAYGLVFYLWKTVIPTGLIPYVRLPDDLALSTGRFAACAVLVVAITLTALLLRRRLPSLPAAWLAYGLILLPNLGLIQIAQQTVTDRYSYLAIMPMMVLLAGGLLKLWGPDGSGRTATRSVLLAGLAIATIALTLSTRRQSLVWQDSASVWNATLRVDPACAVAECNLGEAAVDAGRFAEASDHLSRAIDLEPEFSFAYANFAALLCEAREFEGAAACAERALAGRPPLGQRDLARTHAILGQAYAGLRRDDLAWKHTRMAERLGFEGAKQMLDYLRTVSQEPQPAATQDP